MRSLLWLSVLYVQLIFPNTWLFESVIIERVDEMMLPNIVEDVCVGQPGIQSRWASKQSSSILLRAAAQDEHHKRSATFHSALEIFFEIYLTVFKRLLVVCNDDSALSERWV